MSAAYGFSGKTVAVFGLGASGLSVARALVAGGAHVLAYDDNRSRVADAHAAGLESSDLTSADWTRIDALVLSPGVPLTHPEPHWSVRLARQQGVEVIGDVELFCRDRQRLASTAPLVAVTGTNGKSTTTALIAHCLDQAGRDVQMGGNIGVPILDLAPPASNRVHVIECSSYQIDLAPSLAPSIGVHLNLSPDHIDRHGTFEHYAAVKERLSAASDVAVIGIDDPQSAEIADRVETTGRKVARISVLQPVDDGVYAEGSQLMLARGGERVPFFDLAGARALRGAHNAQNAAAAVAVCLELGVNPDKLRTGLASFGGLDHRMALVVQAGRVLFVNDSKATNADAAERALRSFDRIYWIAGGRPKAGGIDSLRPLFGRIARAYLIGEAASDFAHALEGAVDAVQCETLEVAVAAAARDAAADPHPEPVVLLSPACSSFDQFPNFEARGHAFAEAARLAADELNGWEGS